MGQKLLSLSAVSAVKAQRVPVFIALYRWIVGLG